MHEGERLAAHGPWLSLLFLHLAGPRLRARAGEVEDLVQEVYLRALAPGASPPPPEDGDAALRRYLARTARAVLVDVIRCLRAKKRDGVEVALARSDWSVSSAAAPADLAAITAGPATRAERRDEHLRAAEAFERLSPEHRRVIGLRQLEGLTAAEAARRMGRSETAVHSLYRRALLAWDERRGAR